MKFIDMHCDTLLHMYKRKEGETLRKNTRCVDFERMRTGGSLAQFFALYLLSGDGYARHSLEPVSDDEYIESVYKIFIEALENNSDMIRLARNYNEMAENEKNGRMSAFLTFEDGRAVEGSFERLQRYYDMGIRLITLTWNYKNCFGSPNSTDPQVMSEGLTAFGREAIERMNEMGIIVDVSHLSDGGFWDVVNISKKPFVASHSNARALSPHMRNLTDDMIKAVGNAGGCAGINFAPQFLNEDITVTKSTIKLMAEHARYIKNIGGAECVALGSDLDGIRGDLEIDDVSKMPLLLNALEEVGFTASEIEAVAYGNVTRVIKDVLK